MTAICKLMHATTPASQGGFYIAGQLGDFILVMVYCKQYILESNLMMNYELELIFVLINSSYLI